MQLEDITWLHVEASTRCNAWCPSCPRNLDGYGLLPGLELRDLLLIDLQETIDKLPNLITVQFCENFGDPVIARNFGQLYPYTYGKVHDIRIHTNGSLRNKHWWYELGKQLRYSEHEVVFAIDGMKDTHEIYRQGTNYDKVIKNASAFIRAGGNACWQFIPFKHNEKEILWVMAESQRLGFKRFTVQKDVRLSKSPARNWRTGEEYKIKFWKNDDVTNRFKQNKQVIKKENCMHLGTNSLYLNAKGDIYPCCYLDNVLHYKNNVTGLNTEILSDPHPVCLEECGSCSTEK